MAWYIPLLIFIGCTCVVEIWFRIKGNRGRRHQWIWFCPVLGCIFNVSAVEKGDCEQVALGHLKHDHGRNAEWLSTYSPQKRS